MKKNYSIKTIRNLLKNFKIEEGFTGYPEFFETGSCSWDHSGWANITDKDMEKLINDGLLSYFMIESRYVPATILNEKTQEWLI